MRTVWTLIARGAGVGILGAAIALSPGCRKSRAQLEEEKREERRTVTERKAVREQVKSSAEQEFGAAKELAEKGDYDSLTQAWEKLDKLAAEDEQLAFKFDLYKSETLPTQVFKKVDELSSVDQERFNEANKLLRFVAENMEKKREEAARRINTVHHLENASKAFRQAEGLVRANRHAIAIEQLKAVRDTYADTPYGDMAIVYLRQLEPPAEPTDPE